MSQEPAPARILVVDDDVAITSLLQSVLGSYGYSVEVADDLSALRASRESLPNMILLDLLMPRMGGDEAVRQLRTMPDTRDIPIVLMSSADDVASRAADLGAAGYLSKPFDLDDLLAVIGRILAPRAGGG